MPLPVDDGALTGLHPEDPRAAGLALLWSDLAVGSTSLEVFGHYRGVVDPAAWSATTAAACAALAGLAGQSTVGRGP